MSKLISCQLIEKKKEKREKRREAFPPSFNPSTRGRDNWFRSVGKFSLHHLNFQLTKRSGAYSKRKFLIASPLSPSCFEINSHHHRENSSRTHPPPFSIVRLSFNQYFSFNPFAALPWSVPLAPLIYTHGGCLKISSLPRLFNPLLSNRISSWISSYVICCLNYSIFFYGFHHEERGEVNRTSFERGLKSWTCLNLSILSERKECVWIGIKSTIILDS